MLDLPTVAFYVIAVVLVGSALAVVLLRNIVHAALFLAVFFGAAAGVYVLLNAEFIAIVQMLIYAGAVTILVLFAIMLTQNAMSRNAQPVLRAVVARGYHLRRARRRHHLRRRRQPDGARADTNASANMAHAGAAAVQWPGSANCSIAPSITAMCCPSKSRPSSYW